MVRGDFDDGRSCYGERKLLWRGEIVMARGGCDGERRL